MTLRSIELFTGAGGLALGTHRAGFHHLALMEWDRQACDTLRRNVARSREGKVRSMAPVDDWAVFETDVRARLDDGTFHAFQGVDLVAGGVPCQPFSLGGKHRAHADTRDMFPDFVEVVRATRPRAFLVENVKGLLRASFAPYFRYIVLRLTWPALTAAEGEDWRDHAARLEAHDAKGGDGDLRYDVAWRLLNAADFGVPQTRERVFLVGFRSDLGAAWSFPEPTHDRDALAYDQFVSGAYWKRHRIKAPDVAPWCGVAKVAALRETGRPAKEAWRTVRDALADLPEPTLQGTLHLQNHFLRDGARSYPGHTGSPLDQPAKTLKAGVHGVPGGENMLVRPDGSLRYFTVREAARIQTFPDDWTFDGAWSEAMRQLGNAVPMHLAETVARAVADKLRALG